MKEIYKDLYTTDNQNERCFYIERSFTSKILRLKKDYLMFIKKHSRKFVYVCFHVNSLWVDAVSRENQSQCFCGYGSFDCKQENLLNSPMNRAMKTT
jgi:hypothetical protein